MTLPIVDLFVNKKEGWNGVTCLVFSILEYYPTTSTILHSLSLSLSLSHTHTHTHTHPVKHIHTLSPQWPGGLPGSAPNSLHWREKMDSIAHRWSQCNL